LKYFIHMYENNVMKPIIIVKNEGGITTNSNKGGKFVQSIYMHVYIQK
jgi:hypothetical protein